MITKEEFFLDKLGNLRHPKLGKIAMRDGQDLDSFIDEVNNPAPVVERTQDELDQMDIEKVLRTVGTNDRAMLIAIYRLTKEVWKLRGLTPPTPAQFIDVMKSYKRGAIE